MALLTVRKGNSFGTASVDATLAKVLWTASTIARVAASAGGDTFVNDGKTVFVVENGGASEINFTITKPGTESDGSTNDPVVKVAAGAKKEIGFLKTDKYNDANNQVAITYSGVTTVTVEAVSYAE